MTHTTELATTTAAPRREVVSQYSTWNMDTRASYARMLAGATDLLPAGLKANAPEQTAARVFLALETGDMLGVHPMAALGGIDIIEGQPTISPQLVLGLIRKAGHRVRIEETGTVEGGDLRVTVTIIRHDDPDFPIVKSYSLHDAARAGLGKYTRDDKAGVWVIVARSRNGNPLNWEKYPADMCQWRAVGRAMRAGVSDLLLGVSYFPEELEVQVNADGVRDTTTLELESGYTERIRDLDDKADMAELWQEITKAERWTENLRAEFAAHLSTITKDSRPPTPGAPGQTGDTEIDAQATQTAPTGEDAVEGEIDAEDAAQPHTGGDAGENTVGDDTESEEERFERLAAAEFDAFVAQGGAE